MIEAPPLLVGGVQERAAFPEDADALFIIGAEGGPAGVAVKIKNADGPAADVVARRKLYC